MQRFISSSVLLVTLTAATFAQPSPAPKDQQDTAALTAIEKKETLRYPFADETPAQRIARMAWWHDAKFGMFIHWGIYAIPASGEWYMRNTKTPFAQYSQYAAEFNPTKFNADEWMRIAEDAGIKYLVITAKHHDGFAMFDSKASDYNIAKATPFKRDPLKELSIAAPKHGINFGVYYSYLADWGHPGGQSGGGHWDPAYQDGDIDDYLNKVAVPQVKELLENYGPLGEFWFDNDGSKGMTTARANRFFDLFKVQPQILINPRLIQGDFDTQEQRVTPLRPLGDWEACLTLNGYWGYHDTPAKPRSVILQKMVEVWSKGGNVLLNVGPNREGTLSDSDIGRLAEIGAWMRTNGEAIHGSTNGPFDYLRWGCATTKGNMLYLHVFNWPKDGVLRLPAPLEVKQAYLLADRAQPLSGRNENGHYTLNVPAAAPDPDVSVIALELAAPAPRLQSLALNKPVTTSSNQKNAATITDNDPNTRWKAAKDDTAPTIEVDLGAPATIGAFRLGSFFSKINKFALEVKTGETWTAVVTGGKIPQDSYTGSFPPLAARQVRLRVEEIEPGSETGFTSFELFPPQ